MTQEIQIQKLEDENLLLMRQVIDLQSQIMTLQKEKLALPNFINLSNVLEDKFPGPCVS